MTNDNEREQMLKRYRSVSESLLLCETNPALYRQKSLEFSLTKLLVKPSPAMLASVHRLYDPALGQTYDCNIYSSSAYYCHEVACYAYRMSATT